MAFLGGSIAQRVGLQLLLEPGASGLVFNGACVAAGAVLPAYATYKHLTAKQSSGDTRSSTSSSSHEAERLLKYWAIAGSLYVGERLLERFLSKVPYYPHAKFALLMWLLTDRSQASSWLFDCHLAPFLSRYEVKIDVCLGAGYQVLDVLYSMYRVPLQQAAAVAGVLARQLVVFVKWFLTPEPGPSSLQGGRGPPLSPGAGGRAYGAPQAPEGGQAGPGGSPGARGGSRGVSH